MFRRTYGKKYPEVSDVTDAVGDLIRQQKSKVAGRWKTKALKVIIFLVVLALVLFIRITIN
jgi:hypothetical protein